MKWMENADNSRPAGACRVETCYQARGCPNGVVCTTDIARAVEDLLAQSDFETRLKEKVSGPLKMHHIFRISISGCPNACSRPQIADIGLIGALRPGTSDAPCDLCRSCVDTCRERALSIGEGASRPSIDPGRCLSCGECISACASGIIQEAARGCRVLLGGKLGRRPQLARELDRLRPIEEVVRIVAASLDHFLANSLQGERFGDVLNRTSCDFL